MFQSRVSVVIAGLALSVGPSVADEPKPAPMPLPGSVASATENDYASRPVAYIHGNIPVTRKDLGEFLIARGGAEKVELLVNKMIIEAACQKAGITVTAKEMEAALEEDLGGLSIKKEQFIQVVLPRYGKSYYEWMEDVIRPRLLLSKLCRDRIQITEADLRIQFEREYGEKRRVQIIGWPKSDNLKAIQETYAKIRTSQEEFDRAARSQPNPSLAAANGYVKPISRHLPSQEKQVETRAFSMQPGEVSEIIGTSQGYIVMKLHEIIPPDQSVKFEDVKPRLEKQAFEERMSQEIPKFFAELRAEANPKILFDGPAEWRFSAPTQSAADLLRSTLTPPAAVTTGSSSEVVPASGPK
jgi:hypothetical protein